MTKTIWHYFQRNRSILQFLTHVELSTSKATILEMPRYVAYQQQQQQKMLLMFLLNSVQSLTVLSA